VPESEKSLGIANNMLYRWKEQIESQLEDKSIEITRPGSGTVNLSRLVDVSVSFKF